MKLHSVRLTIDETEVQAGSSGDIQLFSSGRFNGDFAVGNFRSNFNQLGTVELRAVALLLARLASSIDEEIKAHGFCAHAAIQKTGSSSID